MEGGGGGRVVNPVSLALLVSEVAGSVEGGRVPHAQLSEESLAMVERSAEDFVAKAADLACRLAQHRGAHLLEGKDVAAALKALHGMVVQYPHQRPTRDAAQARRKRLREGEAEGGAEGGVATPVVGAGVAVAVEAGGGVPARPAELRSAEGEVGAVSPSKTPTPPQAPPPPAPKPQSPPATPSVIERATPSPSPTPGQVASTPQPTPTPQPTEQRPRKKKIKFVRME